MRPFISILYEKLCEQKRMNNSHSFVIISPSVWWKRRRRRRKVLVVMLYVMSQIWPVAGGDWTPYCLALASHRSRSGRRHRDRWTGMWWTTYLRRVPECRAWNVWLFMKASLECFDNWGHTCIRHSYNNFLVFVRRTKLYGIRTQHSNRIKKEIDNVVWREDEMWWDAQWWRFECVVCVSELISMRNRRKNRAPRGRPVLVPTWDRSAIHGIRSELPLIPRKTSQFVLICVVICRAARGRSISHTRRSVVYWVVVRWWEVSVVF